MDSGRVPPAGAVGVAGAWAVKIKLYPALEKVRGVKYNTGMMSNKKRKAGRPPKPVEEKQGERATVWMTRQERAELERDAAKAGLSLSAYLIDCWRRQREN